MSLENINPDPKLARAWVAEQAFRGDPLQVLDVGARGGFEPHWRAAYGDQVRLYGFEPDAGECARLDAAERAKGGRIFPFALHQESGSRDFYVTAFPAGCGFHEPNAALWRRFAAQALLHLQRSERVPVVDFAAVARREGLPPMDFIKLDTEGCELDILRGGMPVLADSLLGASLEVAFAEIHHGRPLFKDVDGYLRECGFELMDLATFRLSRLALPPTLTPYATGMGPVLSGQALYLRDPVRELEDPARSGFWSPARLRKMISLMDVFNLQDCAAEAIQAGVARGFWGDEAGGWLDLAASSCNGAPIAYEEHMALAVIRSLEEAAAAVEVDGGPGKILAERAEAVDLDGIRRVLRQHLDGLGQEAREGAGARWLRLFLREFETRLGAMDRLQAAAFRQAYHHRRPFWNYRRLRDHIAAHLEGRSAWRIICFGAGQDFRRLLAEGVFAGHRVVAVVDNLRPPGDTVAGIPVIRAEALGSLDHDALVITASSWAEPFRQGALAWTLATPRPRPVI